MVRRDRELKSIQGLFLKYKQTLQAPQTVVIHAFREVVQDIIGIDVPAEAVSYSVSKRIVTIRASGVLVSEIKLHEADIIHHLKGRLGPRSAPKKIL